MNTNTMSIRTHYGTVRALAPHEAGQKSVCVTAVSAAIKLAGGPDLPAHWLRHAGHNQWIVASDEREAPVELRGVVVAHEHRPRPPTD